MFGSRNDDRHGHASTYTQTCTCVKAHPSPLTYVCTQGPIPHPRCFNTSDRSYNLKRVVSIIRKMYLKNMLKSRRRGLLSSGSPRPGDGGGEGYPSLSQPCTNYLKLLPVRSASREQGGMAEEVRCKRGFRIRNSPDGPTVRTCLARQGTWV